MCCTCTWHIEQGTTVSPSEMGCGAVAIELWLVGSLFPVHNSQVDLNDFVDVMTHH